MSNFPSLSLVPAAEAPQTAKEFKSDQEVRWCPGCGDYAILKAVQRTMPEIGATPEKTVFVSGIGCSSRFPYYMETYGFHTIHGRAPAVATRRSPRKRLCVAIICARYMFLCLPLLRPPDWGSGIA